MTLYVYENDTNKIVAEFSGETNAECEAQYVDSEYTDTDIYSNTYTPALGSSDGLHY